MKTPRKDILNSYFIKIHNKIHNFINFARLKLSFIFAAMS